MAEYLNINNVLQLGEPDQEIVNYLKAHPQPPMDHIYSDVRAYKAFSKAAGQTKLASLGALPAGVQKSEIHYTTRDGATIRMLLYQPTNAANQGDLPRSPLIVLYHGGGFCLGQPEGQEQSCRNHVLAFNAVCVAPEYRLAPEFPFPHAINDSWDALQHAITNAASWGADPHQGFIVGGSSAGGHIAAIMSLLARERLLTPPLTGQLLAIPQTTFAGAVPPVHEPYHLAYEQNRAAPALPRAAIDTMVAAYKPDMQSPMFNALSHPEGHAGLPAAAVYVDGWDALRDDGIIYERVLRHAGVNTRLYVYPGMPHGHWVFYPGLKASDKFRREEVEGMGFLLGREPV